MIHPPKKNKFWLKVPKEITVLRETSKQAVRGRISNELQQRWLDFEQRQSNIDKLIYESAINEAANTIHKYRYINGEIELNKLLHKELETFKI